MLPKIALGDEIKFVLLPDGEDPDTLVRKIGKERFLHTLNSGTLFSEFIYSYLSEDIDLSFTEGKMSLATKAKEMFNSIPDGEYKTILYSGFMQRFDLDIYNLNIAISNSNEQKSNFIRNKHKVYSQPINNYNYLKTKESSIIRVLIDYPEFSSMAKHLNLLEINNTNFDSLLLQKLILLFHHNHKIDYDSLLIFLSSDELIRLKDIKEKEGIIDKVSANEGFEERTIRFRNSFRESYETLINNLYRKKVLRPWISLIQYH